MEEGSGFRSDRKGPEVPFVRILGATGKRHQSAAGRRERRRIRAIDGARLLSGRAREIDHHVRSFDLDGKLEWHKPPIESVVVQGGSRDIAPVWNRREVRPDERFAVVVHRLDRAFELDSPMPVDDPA